MAASRFFRYELRTTAVDAARAFYTGVLGSQFWGTEVRVSPLPERAAALGVPAHWLGHISVSDVEGTADRIIAHGGQMIGPIQQGADGTLHGVVRDPFGAVLALSSERANSDPHRARVALQVHHSRDHRRAFDLYAELFGWAATELLDLGPNVGRYQMFAWDESTRTVGGMSNSARLPHIHPQWLFFFHVPDLESSLAKVRASGGKVVELTQTTSGDIVAPCDDQQGATFALYQFLR